MPTKISIQLDWIMTSLLN